MAETDVSITPPRTWAAGGPAAADPLRYSLQRTAVRRTTLTLLSLNQTKGCAWPEPDPAHRHRNEYCGCGGEHDHAARLLERTMTGAAGATATAPRSDGP
ncbi:hypothetical protein [Streptomyces sp. CoH27]|uniref:hypothetical protein n=1 Tax=Streptomyces sp. CoH27 TaxID=2875763 RepID=UPI0027E1B7E8|nr:hypothetical protein [Streptomyces sp. CoH27]